MNTTESSNWLSYKSASPTITLLVLNTMDSFQLIFHSVRESCVLTNLLNHYWSFCLVCGFTCLLLVLYYGYSKIVADPLEKTKIPKLYKITTLHSLWMGLIHLMTTILCFSQMSTFLHPTVSETLPKPFFLKEAHYVVSANFCQNGTLFRDKSTFKELDRSLEEFNDWTSLNTVSIYVVCAVLVQEILLATRNKMDHIFYSRIIGLIFVTSAGRLRCPILSVQGTYLMSINSSSKEIARALVAWKSYSQEDCDHRPSAIIKFLTSLFFVIHMVIWFPLMLFYLPLFIHKLPSVNKDDVDRFFLAYTYLSILAYTVLEAATSPLWTTVRCLGWCRRSSGMTWRILALSDCHLLGHYSPIVEELYHIQMILDQRKALLRNKMVQKHLALVEGRKREAEIDSQIRRPNLLAAVKTVVALKKKLQRRKEDLLGRSGSFEDQLEGVMAREDSNLKEKATSEDEDIIDVMELNRDFGNISKTVLEDEPEAFVKEEEEHNFEKDEEKSIERSLIDATVSRESTAT